MNEALFSRRDALRRGGFTLIEVVIALAIFLFGALAIIRIFPPALGIIQNSGDQLTAVNLNRSLLAKLTQGTSTLPDAIYDESFLTNTPYLGAVVGTAIRNNSLPRNNVQDYNSSALARFKRVVGEKQTVRSFGTGKFYVLTNFPYSGTPAVFREGVIEGVRATTTPDIDTDPNNNNSGVFDLSSASPNPATAISGTVFYVSYKYIEDNIIQGTLDESMTSISNGTDRLLQGRRLTENAANKVIDGPVVVRYREPRTISTVAGENNPNVGLIALTGVSAGDKVSIDYQVSDWRQIVSDNLPSISPEEVPAPVAGDPAERTPREVVLPIRNLADNPVYSLLAYLDPADITPQDGTNTKLDSAVWTTTSTDTGSLWNVNRKAGRALFDVNTHVTSPETRSLLQARVVYSTLDEWTRQLSVAANSYSPYFAGFSDTAPNLPEPWRRYVWDTNDAGRIYFPPSEAGKTILLSYTYNDGSGDKEVVNDVVVIHDRWRKRSEAPATTENLAIQDPNDASVKWLAYAAPKLSISGTPIPIKSINAVRGTSIQARTAWIDGDKFNQVSTIGFRGDSN